jgi:PBP1b-binding outer membrane lipoprotein LpoB
MQKRLIFASLLASAVTFSSCLAGNNKTEATDNVKEKKTELADTNVSAPSFSEDSAFQ